MKIRTLRADEIELRVGTCSAKGFSLLLYKDARCDMNLLDETFGAMNWTRSHEVIDGKLCCTVSIWDDNKGQWISKQDVGTESFTEKDKGVFSDSFKRACVNIGIGRELYTAPFIWISGHTTDANGRYKTDGYDRELKLTSIGYDENRNITELVIKDKSHRAVYSFRNGSNDKSIDQEQKNDVRTTEDVTEVSEKDRPKLTARISELIEEKNLKVGDVYKKIGVDNLAEIETHRLPGMIQWLESMKG